MMVGQRGGGGVGVLSGQRVSSRSHTHTHTHTQSEKHTWNQCSAIKELWGPNDPIS